MGQIIVYDGERTEHDGVPSGRWVWRQTFCIFYDDIFGADKCT